MARIEAVIESEVDEKTRDLLARIRTHWGRSWNVASGLANNPAVLEGFMAWSRTQGESGLSEAERELDDFLAPYDY